MSEISYVDAYRRLDADATRAETQAEQYRQRADHDRWEQCRVAYEATNDGGYSHRGFAAEVGKSSSYIGDQARMWREFADQRAGQNPLSYTEAYNRLTGRPSGAESTAHRGRQIVRNLPAPERAKLAADLLDDPDVADELAKTPDVRRQVSRAVDEAAASSLPDPAYRRPDPTSDVADVRAELMVGTLIRRARFAIRDAIEQARDVTFGEDAASLLVEDLGRLRAGVDHLESAIGSDEIDIDAALADLLKGGES